MTAYKFNKAATAHMSDDSNWSDKNKWECKVEGGRVPLASRVKLVLHIQRVHTLTALEYFRAHKDSLQTDKQHTCQVHLICLNLFVHQLHISINSFVVPTFCGTATTSENT